MNNLINMIQNKIGSDYEVKHEVINKTNGVKMKAFVIKKTKGNFALTVYYNDTDSDEEIYNHVLKVFHDEKGNIKDVVDPNNLLNYDNASVIVYNKEKNPTWESIYVTEDIDGLDLGLLYIINVEMESGIKGTVKLKRELPNIPFDLKEKAYKNIENDILIQTMADVLGFQDAAMEEMLIISNKSKVYGFEAVMTNTVKTYLKDKFGSLNNLIIIPSSIHEAIVLEKKDGMIVDEFCKIIRAVNSTEVSPTDYLSDNAYGYDSNGKLRILR